MKGKAERKGGVENVLGLVMADKKEKRRGKAKTREETESKGS